MKTIKEFVENYKAKRFMSTPQGVNEKAEWLRAELAIKSYIPFRDKKRIAEMIVDQNIKVVDGIKKYSNIDAYIGFIMASIVAHTNLKCGDDPIADYDLLAECGLLPQIVAEFQESHNEIDILLKMAVAYELEDNQPGVQIGKFLDGVLKKLDGASNMLSGALGNLDIEKMFSEENMAKIVGLLNK
jgi:hypothetical protein